MACQYITALAQSIWVDIGSPTDISVSYIQSKLTSAAFVGKMNVLLDTCHQVVNGEITPPWDTDEQGMAALLYQVDFYGRKLLLLGNGTALPWVALSEGDSRISRVSSVDIMRVYRDMQRQLMEELNKLASAYRTNPLEPRDIRFYNIVNSEGLIGYDNQYVS